MKKIVLTLLFTVVCAGSAYAQKMDKPSQEHQSGRDQHCVMGAMDRMGDMMGMCNEHPEKLGLTDSQLEKMKPAHREMQKKHARFNADLMIAEIELAEIMDVKDFDLEKANVAVRKIAEIKTAHQLEIVKGLKDMRSGLTDEQFKKMKLGMSMKMADKKTHKRLKK
jgi:Spy/CpxP family protein refolding chaperone